jgi:hypothetical protein
MYIFRVVNVPNSMTCLTEMLPVSVIMAERKLTGTNIYTALYNAGTELINRVIYTMLSILYL